MEHQDCTIFFVEITKYCISFRFGIEMHTDIIFVIKQEIIICIGNFIFTVFFFGLLNGFRAENTSYAFFPVIICTT
jgi:hypothetical protein